MKTKIIEVTQNSEFNWGKFLVGEFDQEWKRTSALPGNNLSTPLLAQRGWTPQHILVFDFETGEGALFRKQDPYAVLALNDKHEIWVCPMFEPFLAWLGEQTFETVDELPDYVKLDTEVSAMAGRRRQRAELREVWEGIDRIVEAAVEHGVNDEVAAAIAFVDKVLRSRFAQTS